MPTAIITEITASRPLGLRLRVPGESVDILIELADDCWIVHAGRSMLLGELRCGMSVRIPDVRGRLNRSLEVLDLPPV